VLQVGSIVIGFVLFLCLAHSVQTNGAMVDLDLATLDWMTVRRSSLADALMIGISGLGSFSLLGPLTDIWAGGFIFRRCWGPLALLVLTVPGGMLLNTVVKWAFHRARPPIVDAAVSAVTEYSFPSGHTAAPTLFFGFLIVLLDSRRGNRRWFGWAAFGAAAVIVGVAASRVYLRVHYLSDVLASICLHVAWLAIALASVRGLRGRMAFLILPTRQS